MKSMLGINCLVGKLESGCIDELMVISAQYSVFNYLAVVAVIS